MDIWDRNTTSDKILKICSYQPRQEGKKQIKQEPTEHEQLHPRFTNISTFCTWKQTLGKGDSYWTPIFLGFHVSFPRGVLSMDLRPFPLQLQSWSQDKILFTYNGKEAFLNHLRVFYSESKTPNTNKISPPWVEPFHEKPPPWGKLSGTSSTPNKNAGEGPKSGIWTRGTPGVVTSWTIKKTDRPLFCWWFQPTHLKNMRVRQIGSFPQESGWKQKIFELPPPSLFWTASSRQPPNVCGHPTLEKGIHYSPLELHSLKTWTPWFSP